jgi:hypothetical protein
MEDIEQIVELDNELEAQLMDQLLTERNIPHMMRSYHDSAYDGVFQQAGWGNIEAPAGYKDIILTLLEEIRAKPIEETDSDS